MKILYVTLTDPRETNYGGQQRTHVIWKGLCAIPNAEVDVVIPVSHKAQEHVDTDARIYRFCFEKRYSLGWFLQRLFKKMIPYWDCSWAYDWRAMHRHFAGKDIVVSRYIQLVGAFRLWKLAKLYIDADDIHTCEYDAETKVKGNSLWRRLIRFLIGHFQNSMYQHAHHIWLPAREQLNLLEGYPVSYLPNIPCRELPDFSTVLGAPNKLLFVGYMCTDPNIMAIDWFLDTFWDGLKERFPDIEFDIVGSGLPEKFRVKWGRFRDVHLLGFIECIDELYRDSLALLTPMRIGMGSCIKVLESLGEGRCVISTERGLRGIARPEWIPENGLFVFSNLKELLDKILIVQDKMFRLRVQCGALHFSKANFSQKIINETLVNEVKIGRDN